MAESPEASPDIRFPDCCHQRSSSASVASRGTSTLATVQNSPIAKITAAAAATLRCEAGDADNVPGAAAVSIIVMSVLLVVNAVAGSLLLANRASDRAATSLRIRANPEC